jgi:hypothetical protein
MVTLESTAVAIAMGIITMFCWGSWANWGVFIWKEFKDAPKGLQKSSYCSVHAHEQIRIRL